MKNYLAIFVLLIPLLASAQFEQYERAEIKGEKAKKDTILTSRFVKGGDIGLQLGTYTLIKISPTAGFYLTKWALAGIGATYIYTSNKYFGTKGNIYGGNVFVELYPFSFLSIHAEYEALYLDMNYLQNPYWNQSYLLGPGYRQKLGTKASVNYLLLWDFNYSANTPYSNPRFKILFLF